MKNVNGDDCGYQNRERGEGGVNEIEKVEGVRRKEVKGIDKGNPIRNKNECESMSVTYASVLGISVNKEGAQSGMFKNMYYKDSRSNDYIKKGIWWLRQKGITMEMYKKCLIEKYGKGSIKMLYQVSYKRIEAFVENEMVAIKMAQDEIIINETKTKINLMNNGPTLYCIKNVMPWIEKQEIVEVLSVFGYVEIETIKYLPVLSDDKDDDGDVMSGSVTLYINKKNNVVIPQYFSPKIKEDYYRWYMAPMKVKCFNCDGFGHWAKFCGNDFDQEKMNKLNSDQSDKQATDKVDVDVKDKKSENEKSDGEIQKDEKFEKSEEGQRMNHGGVGENVEIVESEINEGRDEVKYMEDDRISELNEHDKDMIEQIEKIMKEDMNDKGRNEKNMINEKREIKDVDKNKEKGKEEEDGRSKRKRGSEELDDQEKTKMYALDMSGNGDELDKQVNKEIEIFEIDEKKSDDRGRRTTEEVVKMFQSKNEEFIDSKKGKVLDIKMDDRDKEDLKKLKKVLKEGIMNKKKRIKAYTDEVLKKYDVHNVERLKKENSTFFVKNGLEVESKNFIAAIKKLSGGKGGVKIAYKTQKEKVEIVAIQKEKYVKRQIPECSSKLTQLIKTIDQAEEAKIEDRYQEEFFEYVNEYEWFDILGKEDALRLLQENNRMKSLLEYVRFLHEIRPESSCVEKIENVIVQYNKYGRTEEN